MKIKPVPLKVMIVDDERKAREFNAGLVAQILPDCEITKVECPQEALQLMKENNYDLLFCDMVLPQMNGISLLNEISKLKYRPYTIVVSAFDRFEYAQPCIELGVSSYILKPATKEKLAQKIDVFLKSKRHPSMEIMIKTGISNEIIHIDDIVAITKSDRNYLDIILADRTIKNVREYLREINKYLPDHFSFINRQCIINHKKVRKYDKLSQEIILCQKNSEISFIASREGFREFISGYDSVIG
jgi:DNA-binding LytR/AlgR family response regulator